MENILFQPFFSPLCTEPVLSWSYGKSGRGSIKKG